ncbi:MAG: CotH kinase family protein, partial [Phycisphaerales bacterium]|nr:CotH kinase family protein [Phycisphaerales bacterium]
DADGDGVLDRAEREQARAFLKSNAEENRGPGAGPGMGPGRRGGRGPGGRGGFGPRGAEPGRPGPKVAVDEVETFPNAPLYAPHVLRTFFLEFEDDDWEAELADFYNTDVEVPATLIVDGVRYPNVGVHFRGASSFFMVPEGSKRSLNVSLDFVDREQRLDGYRTLNLLNGNGDPSFMSTVLYAQMTREHIPAPQANFAKVVINGESWGVYTNVEQFNRDFVERNFATSGKEGGKGKGARWKVKGRPNGASGLDYVGDDLDAYRARYQIKSKDDNDDWRDLVELCRVLSTTPLDELEDALRPILDVDGVLWFLAFDNVLANSDGYWVRASDYSIYKDPNGVFHIVPHDMNEAFGLGMGGPGPRGPGGGPGGRGPRSGPGAGPGFGPGFGPGEPPLPPDALSGPRGPAGGGDGADGQPPAGSGPGPGGQRRRAPDDELDPLVGMDDAGKPLRSRLLAVPAWRARYLEHVRQIAEHELDWRVLGPRVASWRALIEEAVEADTRKLDSTEAFLAATADASLPPVEEGVRQPLNLRTFAERRCAFLLSWSEVPSTVGEVAGKSGGAKEPSSR